MYDFYEDPENGYPPRSGGSIIIFVCYLVLCLSIAGLLFLIGLLAWPASAHEATSITGQPLGVEYPSGCCRAATEPGGDCAPIDDKYVTLGEDGYHVDLPIGAHPKLIHKGYSGVIPYASVKQPISNDYHICLSTDGGSRYCFFPKPGTT